MIETYLDDYLQQQAVDVAWRELRSVPDDFIAAQTPENRARVAAALREQAARWDVEMGKEKGDE